MPAFRFGFEIVLRHRTLVEDQCQRDLAKVLRHKMILEDQLRQMQETIVDSKRQLGSGLIGRVDLDRVAQFARYSGQVAQRARDIVQKLVTAEKQIEIARQKLLKATRDRKALELLRDRQFRRWKMEQDRREAAAMDELAVQSYARRLVLGDVE
jgi:flagellar protein FliJ